MRTTVPSTTPTLLGPTGKPVASTSVPASAETDRQTLTRIVETRMTRGMQNVIAYMPDPDELIAQEGLDIYRKMRSDDAVWAAEFQMMTRILGRPWDVRPPQHPKGDAFAVGVAEHVKGVFASMITDQMLEHLYRALRLNRSGGQLLYRMEGSALVPERFVAEPASIFRFGYRGEVFVKLSGKMEEAAPYKWQTHVNEPERPNGRSIFSRIYCPWKFKRVKWNLWLQAMDRFAVPSLAALFETAAETQTTAAELAEELTDQLENVASGSVGALANTKQLAQVGGSTAIQGFDKFVEMCDRSIYRAILTVTLTISEGRQGAERGNTTVHDGAADQVAYYYGNHLAGSITHATAAYAALLKFGENAPPALPHFVLDFEEPISSERLIKFMELGFPMSMNALYSSWGVPEPEDDEDAFVSPKVGGVVGGGVDDDDDGGDDAAAGGDGQASGIEVEADMVRLTGPRAYEGEVRKRMHTVFRDIELVDRFERLVEEGATWDEAADALTDHFPLSAGRIRNIYQQARK